MAYSLHQRGPRCLFAPHPNLSEAINRNVVRSEIEGGVYLHDLGSDAALEIVTENHYYTVLLCDKGVTLIYGHPVYCPAPVQVRIAGSNWGGSMLKVGFIGRGMRLEFCHPGYRTPIVTSRIREIREISSRITVPTVAQAHSA